MSNKHRKQDAHTRRVKRHEAKRAEKRKAARAYQSTPTKAQRRSNVIQFPKWAMPVFQANRKARAA